MTGIQRIIEPNRSAPLRIVVSSATVEGTLDMSADGTRQFITSVFVEIAGVTGEVTLDFYDGATSLAGTLLNDTPLYVTAQPSTGFKINKYLLTGKLTIAVVGATNTGKIAHATIQYAHK